MSNRTLGLSRNQYGFLGNDSDAMDQFEVLFEQTNQTGTTLDGGALTGTVTLESMAVGDTVNSVYKATGGNLTVNLPADGTYSVYAIVTVDNTFTTSPSVKVGRGITGAIVSGMASGSSLFCSVLRLT